MKDINFDNPYLLLIAIPFLLIVILPFFIVGNKDNRSLAWKLSIVTHVIVVTLVSLAVAGLKTTSVLTKTTVYVVADVSYSSNKNLEEIDGYIAQIKEELPENSKLGVVCFGKSVILLTPAGRELKSVAEANVDNSATDIAGALNYTEKLFKDDSIKRIVLITDGNDTVSENVSSVGATVARLRENNIKIDTVFLDNNLKEGDTEVQLSNVSYSKSKYIGRENPVEITLEASKEMNVVVELFSGDVEESIEEKEQVGTTILYTTEGLNTVTMDLPSNTAGTFGYTAKVSVEGDGSSYNNLYSFTQEIVGKAKILLITGKQADEDVVRLTYGNDAEIETYLVRGEGSFAPCALEDIIEYDEIVVANVDIRDIKNANAFIDSLDIAISQYGKSLITFGDLRLQSDSEDRIFQKFKELLPVNYGNSKREGRSYTIVLDVSDSMFMASKFTTAKESAIKLLSIVGDDDYVSLITFSGEIKVQTPKKAKNCRQDLIAYIDSLSTDHGTDLGLGLEEALKTIKALKLEENQVMIISDGFSFDSERTAVEVAKDLYAMGTVISAINTYDNQGTGGRTTLKNVVNAGKGGNYYEIKRPEDVEMVIFGSVADDVGNVIIEEDSIVNIVRYNDDIVQDFDKMPLVSGYIISMETYDAVVPLTVNYLKSGGYTETLPLYAYRMHGNGKVSSFTSDLSGDWTKHWSDEEIKTFASNMFTSNTPKERWDMPFTISDIDPMSKKVNVEIIPSVLNPEATTTLKISLPNGRKLTRELPFDAQKYFYELELVGVGTYTIEITYKYDDKQYDLTKSFYVPYLAEYDAFTGCDTSIVNKFMRGNGEIYDGEIPDLENDKSEISTYQVNFKVPLLIAAVSVFVADIVIRKFSFGKKKKTLRQKGGAK